VAAIFDHVVFMALDEVIHHVVGLWNERLCIPLSHKLGLLLKQVLFVECPEFLQVFRVSEPNWLLL
jgi:hypothetical protein